MNVYLVPIGRERYDLYCEVPDDPPDLGSEPRRGLIDRSREWFSTMLAQAERERQEGDRDRVAGGWATRLKARAMRWVAESIAEQRLLWHLRRQGGACLFYPDDLDEQQAVALLRRQLGRDFEKHRFWLIVDSVGLLASTPFVVIPGPNVFAYYFVFRIVGHYLSMRGARQGLQAVAWTHERSAPLSGLRHALDLPGEERQRRVDGIAHELNLEHLARFFNRTAVREPREPREPVNP
jgi:hypothetical protein